MISVYLLLSKLDNAILNTKSCSTFKFHYFTGFKQTTTKIFFTKKKFCHDFCNENRIENFSIFKVSRFLKIIVKHQLKMKLKIISLFILLLAFFATFWKFEFLNQYFSSENFSIKYLKEIFKLSDTCKPETLIIWTAASIKSYDKSICKTIKNVSAQLNHSLIEESNENGTWDIIWSYEYIFDRFPNNIRFMKLKPNQMVNHFPGLTFMTNKLHLAVSTTQRFIPSSFNFPSLKNEFLYFAKIYPHNHFVEKSMDRGGIKIVPFEEINFGMGSWR